MASEGLATSVPFDVWHPGALSLEADDTELNLLEGCSGTFEATRLRLRSDQGGLDVTPLLGSGAESGRSSASVCVDVWPRSGMTRRRVARCSEI